MITDTLIQGLNEKMVQFVVNKVDVKPFTYNTHFPIKKVNGFEWKMVMNQNGRHNVAADIVADNATVQRKSRPIFESANGDLPRISISRDWKRSEIKAYQTALLHAADPNAQELVKYYSEDVEFCFTGVQSQLEYMAWAIASDAGVLKVTNKNNASAVSEFDLDYQVDDTQRMNTSVSFANKANADVIQTFVDAVNMGKKINSKIKYAFTSMSNFYRIATTDQIIKNCASYIQTALKTAQTPDLAQVNMMLKSQPWLNGIQLIVIDTDITREFADGSTGDMENPFIDHRMIFSETSFLGSTQYDILRTSQASKAIRVERGHTVVKKYSTDEPVTEVTLGEADAMPVLDTVYKNIYVKTDATTW